MAQSFAHWLHKRRLKAFDRFKDLPIEPDILFSRYSNLFGDLKISNLDNSLTDKIDNFDSNNVQYIISGIILAFIGLLVHDSIRERVDDDTVPTEE